MTLPLDLAGLGAGPFNLSIAALIDGLNSRGEAIRSSFFERKPSFSWHPGMLLPDARVQTSYLKDLVTGVAPTNPHSFLNYLVSHKRFYQFLSAELSAVSRAEYANYLKWVSERLPMVQYNTRVQSVDFSEGHFLLHIEGESEPVAAKNICLGTGKSPYVPECARPHMGGNVFHAIGIAQRDFSVEGLRVAVVGGGQTGAEVFQSMMDSHWGAPASVHWVSRRQNFEPLDETPFTNEFFTPQYVDTFFKLPVNAKQNIVASQKLASDGISPDTLKALYQKLYERAITGQTDHLDLRPYRELTGMTYADGHYTLEMMNGLHQQLEKLQVDVVILCTGFESEVPAYLDNLRHRLSLDEDGRFNLTRNFEVVWDGPEANRIFAVNAGRHSHGIAEPQMSLMCWRSASIINTLLGEPVFDLEQSINLVNWGREAQPEVELAFDMAI
ncbi:lysine N(6)-hydroxylase/L-ornithine N(5)-oxygenase family protein [Hahella ganghwensis]|uniref:lysine N(6)-hydroxylase/L-ornithine N(5)-oxygenase family protein n=1 Tax=Hahella ganghwensis TaxID=286420 RepID=UPI00037A33D1|nr:SidA/IucD/PvdA family monooxygenase [Hahella ganghwensis]